MSPDHGVVVRQAVLRAGPGLRAESRAELDEGALVRIAEQRDAWVRVRTAGEEGWIEQRDVGLLD